MDNATRNNITRLATEPYRRLRTVGVVVAVIGLAAAAVLIVLAATHSPVLDDLNGYRMSSSSDSFRNSSATATIIAYSALAAVGGACIVVYATYKLRLENRLAAQNASRPPTTQAPAQRSSQLAAASRRRGSGPQRGETGKRAMITPRVRAYELGDRVRVWFKPGERGFAGEVVALRPGGVVVVALDGRSGTVKPQPGHMDLLRPEIRRRHGLIMLGASALAIVLGVLLLVGAIPAPDLVRGGILLVDVAAIYVIICGVLALRDARDPLRPLPTYDPTKNYTTNSVD